MILQTGGVALAEISTRSRSFSRAISCACAIGTIPTCFPSKSISRTSATRIMSLMRFSGSAGLGANLGLRRGGKIRRSSCCRWVAQCTDTTSECQTNAGPRRLTPRRPLTLRCIALLHLLLVLTACRSAVPPPDAEALRVAAETRELLARYAMYGFDGVALVSKHGRIAMHDAFGRAAVDQRFDAGSIMKTFVAAAVLRLEEEGRLRTTDTVAQHLGALDTITIHQLLTHTSGLPLDPPNPAAIASNDDLVAAAAKATLTAPGHYSYSN